MNFFFFFWFFSPIFSSDKSPASGKENVRFLVSPDFENLPDFRTGQWCPVEPYSEGSFPLWTSIVRGEDYITWYQFIESLFFQEYIWNSTTWHCDPEPSWLSRNEEMGLIFSKAKQNGDALIWYTLYLWIIDGDWRVGYKTHAITNVCILYTRCAVRREDS